MARYRLLTFAGNRLVRSEQFEAAGLTEALDACTGRGTGERLELWTEDGRIARLGPSVARHVDLR